MDREFDELYFFASIKKRPGMYLGEKSLLSLRDCLHGMCYAFHAFGQDDALKYFDSFVRWYNAEVLHFSAGYACWWNHLMYISGGSASLAFDMFFREFEKHLKEKHDLTLPNAENLIWMNEKAEEQ